MTEVQGECKPCASFKLLSAQFRVHDKAVLQSVAGRAAVFPGQPCGEWDRWWGVGEAAEGLAGSEEEEGLAHSAGTARPQKSMAFRLVAKKKNSSEETPERVRPDAAKKNLMLFKWYLADGSG